MAGPRCVAVTRVRKEHGGIPLGADKSHKAPRPDGLGVSPLVATMIFMPAQFRMRPALLLLFVLAIAFLPARAATYFIDAELGHDGWSGRAISGPSAPSTDGPWRTLARVRTATLQPGDELRLRCGQTWNETLRVTQSGASGNPILIGAYPEPCATPPAIDGRVLIPADNWVKTHGNVYRATVPPNLVQNGALDRSVTHWSQPVAPRGTLAFKRACSKPVVGCLHFTTPKKGKGLLSSSKFALKRGARYRATYSIFVPKGVTVTARIRRSGPSDFTVLASPLRIVGTGIWQQKTFTFNARRSAIDARLDFEVPALRSGAANAQLRNVAIQPYMTEPLSLLMGGRPLQSAHHPNFGYDPAAPDSVYLRNAEDSDTDATVRGGSSFVTTGDDLRLPAGASLTPDLTIRIRSENWNLDQRTVTSVVGTRVEFAPGSSYPIDAGWGYFFLGAPWMVDSPDEWYYDKTTRTFTVWMPDSGTPGNRVMLTNVDVGIDLTGLHDIVLERIAVRGVMTGVVLGNAQDTVVRGMTIEDTRGRGVTFPFGQRIAVESSIFRRTGTDAISACKLGASGCGSQNMARSNRIQDSGVLRIGQRIVSLPMPQEAAITLGQNSTIISNRIVRGGSQGVFLRGASIAANNAIVDTCMVLDDCGAIYSSITANGSQITGNLVQRVIGNINGTIYKDTRAVGIYVDEQATNLLVDNNAATEADNGIQVHNAFANTIRRNVLFGNRNNQLWLQEDTNATRANGDIHSNTVTDNVLVPLEDVPALRLQTILSDVNDFAGFAGNTYSGLLGGSVALEMTPTEQLTYTLPEWQLAEAGGTPRNLDTTGRSIKLQGFAAFRKAGTNIVPNGNLANGLAGWSRFNDVSPDAQMSLGLCPGPCAKLVAGGSSSLMSTPNFSVLRGQRYRVSFDAATGVNGEFFTVVPRRGGGGEVGFERIDANTHTLTGTTAMRRYTFTFQATLSVTLNDPATNERGARIDFQGILPGRALTVANVEMVPIDFQDVTLKIAAITNDDPVLAVDVPCPDAAITPANCNAYVALLDATPVTFPHHLEPLQAKVIYTRDLSLVDTDSDGITDSQDSCPRTSTGRAANSSGCDITQ